MRISHSAGTILLGLAAATLGAADYEASYLYSAPWQDESGNEITQQEAAAKGIYKLVSLQSSGYDLSTGLDLQMNTWDFDDHGLEDIELYKIQVPLAVGFMPTEKIYVLTTLEYGLHSDMQSIDSEDFRLQGALIGTYLHSADLQFILGVGYSDDFGEPQAYPIGGVSWKPVSELKLDLIFPMFAATYIPHEDFHLVAGYAPSGGQWRWDYDTATGETGIDAALKGQRFEFGGEYQVLKDGWLRLTGGVELNREITLSLADDASVNDSLDLPDSAFARIGFRLSH